MKKSTKRRFTAAMAAMLMSFTAIPTVYYQPCYQVSASNVQTFSRSADGEKNLSANFKVKEFACKDGSDEILIDLDLVDILQRIRDHFGAAVTINSAYRTESHNASVGGASNSYHLYGRAADISVSGVSPAEVAKYAESMGVRGIGKYGSFVHVDTRENKYFWVNSGSNSVSTFGGDPPPEYKTDYIRRGDRGDRVVWLQQSLEALGYDIGSSGADGIFGGATESAVKALQSDHGLSADGIVGPATESKINELLNPPAPEVKRGSNMGTGNTSQTLPDGDYAILTGLDCNSYVDIIGSAVPAETGTNVNLWHRTAGTLLPSCDVWTIKSAGNGFYTIAQKGTNMMLEVAGADTAIGANVQVYKANGTDAQLWSITNTETGYKIQSKCNGYCLDVSGGVNESGRNMIVWESNDTAGQRFALVPYGPSVGKTIADGEYTIEYAASPAYCIDAQGYSDSEYKNGTNVQLWQTEGCNDSFKIKHVGDGMYTITESKSGYVLDINCGSNYLNNSNNIQLFNSNSGLNQKWIIKKNGSSYNIISALNGLCLELYSGKAEPRGNISQFIYNNSAAQKWDLVAPVGMKMKTTFDAMSGNVDTSSKTVTYSKTYGDLPVPTRTGYTFDGWYTAKNGGTKVTSETKVEMQADHALYAHWTANTYNITLDTNCGNDNVIVLSYQAGDRLLSGFTAPELEGCTFVGWSKKQYEPLDELTSVADEIIKPNADVIFTEDTTLYAVWIKSYDKVSEVYYADVDLDGKITDSDKQMIIDLIGQETTPIKNEQVYADVNGDGTVDSRDAEALDVIIEYGMDNEGTLSYFYAWKRRYIPIEMGPDKVILHNGEQYTIPTDEKNPTFSSSNPKVAVVSKNGMITAIGEGTATITLVTFDSAVAQIEITVVAADEPKEAATLYGDVNLDGKVTAADATAIMQYIANRDKYTLSGQSLVNADVYGGGDGITAMDAFKIQQVDSGLITEAELIVD